MRRSAIRNFLEFSGDLKHLFLNRRMFSHEPFGGGVARDDLRLEALNEIFQIGELRFQQRESFLYRIAIHGREYTIIVASVERAPSGGLYFV